MFVVIFVISITMKSVIDNNVKRNIKFCIKKFRFPFFLFQMFVFVHNVLMMHYFGQDQESENAWEIHVVMEVLV